MDEEEHEDPVFNTDSKVRDIISRGLKKVASAAAAHNIPFIFIMNWRSTGEKSEVSTMAKPYIIQEKKSNWMPPIMNIIMLLIKVPRLAEAFKDYLNREAAVFGGFEKFVDSFGEPEGMSITAVVNDEDGNAVDIPLDASGEISPDDNNGKVEKVDQDSLDVFNDFLSKLNKPDES